MDKKSTSNQPILPQAQQQHAEAPKSDTSEASEDSLSSPVCYVRSSEIRPDFQESEAIEAAPSPAPTPSHITKKS